MTEKSEQYLSRASFMTFKRNNGPKISAILNFMARSEYWVVDSTPALRPRFERVKFPLSTISIEDSVKLACYCGAPRATSFMSLKGNEHGDYQEFMTEIDKIYETSEDPIFHESVNVLKARMLFMARLGVLSSVFSSENRKKVKGVVKRALEEQDGY